MVMNVQCLHVFMCAKNCRHDRVFKKGIQRKLHDCHVSTVGLLAAHVSVCRNRDEMPPNRAPKNKEKKDFVWSDDEAELLLNVTHDYKIQHLVNGTCWKSVKSKYADILELFRKELPPSEEEASRLIKTTLTSLRMSQKKMCCQN